MAKSTNPFHYFGSSPEVIRTEVMMYVEYPLSIRNVEENHFNQDHHLISRDDSKARRSAAPTEWRTLAA